MAKKYNFNNGSYTGGKGYTPTKKQTDLLSSTLDLAQTGANINQFTPEQIASYEAMGGQWITTQTGGGCGDSIGNAFGDIWEGIKDVGQTIAPIVTGGLALADQGVREQAGQNIKNIEQAGRDINQGAIDAYKFVEENAGDWLETVAPIVTGGLALADEGVRNQAEQNLNQVGQNIQDIDPLEVLGYLGGGFMGGLAGDIVTDQYENMQDAEARRIAGEQAGDAELERDIADETADTVNQVDDEQRRRRDFLRGLNPTGSQGLAGRGGRRRMLIGF